MQLCIDCVIVQPVNQGDIKIVVSQDPNLLISNSFFSIRLFLDEQEYFKVIFMKQVIDIFLFVNPRSGSRMGQRFLNLGFQKVTFELNTSSKEWVPKDSASSTVQVIMHIVDVTS